MQLLELEPWACIRRHNPLKGVVSSVGNCISVVCTLTCTENDITEPSKVLACDELCGWERPHGCVYTIGREGE